ncbi:MAG: aminotransferase class I/II-fold pyridoxal phosphate-dependent enzyme [Acidobacteria bacterium]|nr:aminotransferase class I/II-fold pyridoxal phosphate-dependent enzyme [Acidobacteriota bacterium]
MSPNQGLNRRAFLKNAGVTALVGAVGTGTSIATGAVVSAAFDAPGGTFDFDTPYNRIGTDSVKWDQQIRTYGKDNIAVGMGIADMDFKTAPAITKALMERLQHENWGYLDMPRSFAEGIVSWNQRRYGIDINPDLLVITTGVHPGLIAALKTFSPPGSKVLLTTPTYNGFYGDLTFCHLKAEESPMKLVDGRYSIDFDDFERRISHDTNTFILCNPQNPTGNCWSPEDLTRLGEICLRRRVVVLADEIHCDFVTRGNKYTPFASLPNKAIVNNSLTFKAASKSFGLAAMKCAWFFSDNADYLARVKANNRADLTTLGMIASRAAYADGEDWLNQCVAYIDGNHDFVESFVRANIPLVKCVKPQGTYLAWLDVSQVADRIRAQDMAAAESGKTTASGRPVTAETIVERYVVKSAKVHLNAGSTYGYGGAGHMRMNIATSRKTLELALTNLASALKNT